MLLYSTTGLGLTFVDVYRCTTYLAPRKQKKYLAAGGSFALYNVPMLANIYILIFLLFGVFTFAFGIFVDIF